jgi:tetratricopeptide (TPR) repeat protein
MIETENNKLKASDHVWHIHDSGSDTSESLKLFERAVRGKKISQIFSIIREPANLRSFVVRRGENSKALHLLIESFKILLADCGTSVEEFEKGDTSFLEYLKKHDIPEQYLNEITNAAYHIKDKANFYLVINYIIRNKELFGDKQVPVRALHDLASWKASKEGNFDEAIKLNKQVIAIARKSGFGMLEKKAVFGLAYQKQIKYKNKIEGFEEVSHALKHLHRNEYDALRGQIEKNWNILRYARYKSGDFKQGLLDKAKDGALENLKSSIEIGYKMAEILASELLGEIYQEMGDNRKANSYKKRAKKIALS